MTSIGFELTCPTMLLLCLLLVLVLVLVLCLLLRRVL
jgi:hypothetical protein